MLPRSSQGWTRPQGNSNVASSIGAPECQNCRSRPRSCIAPRLRARLSGDAAAAAATCLLAEYRPGPRILYPLRYSRGTCPLAARASPVQSSGPAVTDRTWGSRDHGWASVLGTACPNWWRSHYRSAPGIAARRGYVSEISSHRTGPGMASTSSTGDAHAYHDPRLSNLAGSTDPR